MTEQAALRARRATDVIQLVAAGLGLALLALMASPPSGFEQALITFVSALPSALDGLCDLLVDGLGLLAVLVVVVQVARRRWLLARDVVLAALVAVALSLLVGRLVEGSWPELWQALRSVEPPPAFPLVRIAMPGAVVLTALPHLRLPARRLGRWTLGLGALSAVVIEATTPGGALAGFLVAVASAALVHVLLGSSDGRPGEADVVAALAALGIPTSALGAPDRQPSGYFLLTGRDGGGRALVVKVYGRDAHDTKLLATLWRTLWYREAGSPVSTGRLQQVEHEAFLTLLAAQAGVPTDAVAVAGSTASGDALLALRPGGRPLAERGEGWSPGIVERAWALLAALHEAGIAHGQLDDQHLIAVAPAEHGTNTASQVEVEVETDVDDQDEVEVETPAIGVIDFRGASIAPRAEDRRTDQAQLLVTGALALGVDAAVPAALDALGADGLAAALPYVQRPALTPRQWERVRDSGMDLDDLRNRAAEAAGVEEPRLQQLRRVSWGALLQMALLAFAFVAMASALSGVDLDDLSAQLADARWWFVVVGAIVAQLPRLAQAVATLGASPIALPLGPVYALQLAVSYVGLAVPSAAGRVAVNIRFFQRHGLSPGSAVAIGAIDGFSGFVVQAALLLTILLFTSASLDLQLGSDAAGGLGRLLVVVVALGVVAAVVLLAVPRWRRPILARLRELLADAFGAVRGLRSPRRISLLLGGNLASEILFATALGLFTRAFGYAIGFEELLFVNMTVALLSGLLPVPGGIGVVEGGLVFGLTRAGMSEEAAFAAVMLYRLATFYIPPVWGFFAFRWLERRGHL